MEVLDLIDNIMLLEGRRGLNRERVFQLHSDDLRKYNDEDFFRRYKFSKATVMLLEEMLRERLFPRQTRRNHALSTMQVFLTGLGYLTSGCRHIDQGSHFMLFF